MKIRSIIAICLLTGFAAAHPVYAGDQAANSQAAPASQEALMGLAKDFVRRISKGFAKADQALKPRENQEDIADRLPEGEELLFQIKLTDQMILQAPLLGKIINGEITLSMRDFFAVLEFPITLDSDAGVATGWYIRESKTFNFDLASRSVRTDNGEFQLSDAVTKIDDDVFVPIEELTGWFGFKTTVLVSGLEIKLETPMPLPVQERLARHKQEFRNRKIGPAVLPLVADENKMLETPVVDVLSRSSYTRPGQGGSTTKESQLSVATAGDFLKGTLSTQSLLDREEKLTSLRATYTKQSLEPELLGSLQARKYQIGDVHTARMPLDNKGFVEQGFSITNVHPLRSSIRPSTVITGTTFPGWDVELYRDQQLLAFQTAGPDGTYEFNDVGLFRSDNNFRVVMYGLQGEVREETVYVPVDNKRLSEQGSAYEVSLSRQDTQTYRKDGIDDVDEGSPHLAAVYETPIGDASAVMAGVEAKNVGNEYIGSVQGGYSTEINQTLFNLNGAVDSHGEMGAELVARRDFGKHKLRNDIDWATDEYGLEEDEFIKQTFAENLNLYGPLPWPIGRRPHYNLSLGYEKNSAGIKTAGLTAGVSTSWRRLSVDQQFNYEVGFDKRLDSLDSVTTLTGNVAGNRLQLISNYQVKPESNLESMEATVLRRINKNLDLELGLERDMDTKDMLATAQLDWDAGYARISPGISYNTDRDFTAQLTTRFGLAKDPLQDKYKMYSTPGVSAGSLSAFVYLDANGDNVYNEGEEPIPEAIVKSLQSGGQEETDESGHAFFSSLREMLRTDVILDPESLKDPYWVPGTEGVSILPRAGHVAQLQFPVHNAGEMDGTIYLDQGDDSVRPLDGVRLALYKSDGNMALSAFTAPDGFFLLSKIPPGQYSLVINSDDAQARKFVRPEPEIITIGYDGTTIYGHDIHVLPGADVATVILADIPAHDAAVDDLLKPGAVLLNLGQYNSRLLMGLTWYRLKMQYAAVLGKAFPVIAVTSSEADPKTGKHTLRVVIAGDTQKKAMQRCRTIMEGGFACAVESIPEKIKMASAE